MTNNHDYPLGNPVDTWWNNTRQHLDTSISLLAQFPPAPNSNAAADMIGHVQRTQQHIANYHVPSKAQKIYDALMECLKQLEISLREQAVHGLMMRNSAHNIAYHQFLMVSYYLLQRGIYEPEPTAYRQQQAS